MNRTKWQLIRWLLFDAVFLLVSVTDTLNALRHHNTVLLVLSVSMTVVWCVLAWRELDRWTGPPRSVKRRNSVSR